MKIAVTGHRPDALGVDYLYKDKLWAVLFEELKKIVEERPTTEMISGMALGVDMLWAMLAIRLNIKLHAAIPCAQHSAKWPAASRKMYQTILDKDNTDIHFVSEEPYTPYCMQVRNKYMVDRCDLLVAVWNGNPGGTGNCVKYAQKVGRPIIIIDPNKLNF